MKPATDLLSILTFSDRRRDILFLLEEKPRTLSDIKDYFGVKSPEILPRLKQMEVANLIIKQDGMYQITLIGKVAAMYYRPLLDTLTAFENNMPFWISHDLSMVPEEFVYRIGELKNAIVIKEEDCYFESHPIFVKNVMNAERIEGVATVFNPSWINMFTRLAKREASISIIVTRQVLAKIQETYSYDLEEFLKSPNVSLRVLEFDAKIAFSATDDFLSLALFRDGTYDHQNDLVGFDLKAIKWGKDLFKYYLENSVKIESGELAPETFIQESYSQSLSI